jgi:hypothetical protein
MSLITGVFILKVFDIKYSGIFVEPKTKKNPKSESFFVISPPAGPGRRTTPGKPAAS